MAPQLDVHQVRSHFPALKEDQVYFDNAGGTQVLSEVIDSMREYMLKNNVQLGATYRIGGLSTAAYNKGIAEAASYVNASPDEIVVGPSTTQLFRNLSIALLQNLSAGDEIVCSELDHEANIAAWVQLAQWKSLTLKWWSATDKQNPRLEPSVLKPLLSPKTKLVTCTHTSNILGTITDIRAIADTVHTVPGAKLCVDGVAFAPHRAIDVQAFGVDFYSFSWYKVYGPHIAMLFVTRKAQDTALTSLGHYFKEHWTLEDKLGLGGANYECVQAIPNITRYLREIGGWTAMAEHETRLQEILLSYLRKKAGEGKVKIFGEPRSDLALRVPVVSFEVKGRGSRELVETMEKKTPFGFCWGHFYSKRLVEGILGCGEDGVVRVSMTHYNTEEEAEAFVKALDAEISGQ